MPRQAMATVNGVTHRLKWLDRNSGWRMGCSCGWADPKLRGSQSSAINAGNAHITGARRAARTPHQKRQTRSSADSSPSQLDLPSLWPSSSTSSTQPHALHTTTDTRGGKPRRSESFRRQRLAAVNRKWCPAVRSTTRTSSTTGHRGLISQTTTSPSGKLAAKLGRKTRLMASTLPEACIEEDAAAACTNARAQGRRRSSRHCFDRV